MLVSPRPRVLCVHDDEDSRAMLVMSCWESSSSSPRVVVAPSLGKSRGPKSELDSTWRCLHMGEPGSPN